MSACLDAHRYAQLLVADVSGRIGDEGIIQVMVLVLQELQHIFALILVRTVVDDDHFVIGIVLFQNGGKVLPQIRSGVLRHDDDGKGRRVGGSLRLLAMGV